MIISIDIGIRNLAFCGLDCIDKTDLSSYKIHLWNVFDTLEDDNHQCGGIQKSGKICGKKCGFKYKNEKELIYCCKTHFPKTLKVEKENIFKKKLISTYLLQDIAKTVLTKLQEIYDTNKIIFEKTSQIIIELQPSLNQKMKFISHIIYGKLVELYYNTNTTIRFVRASQKLKSYTGPEIECKLKGAYAKRKWLSIKYGYWFLENKFNKEQRDIWLPFLDTKKNKLDDVFDVLLMAINGLFGIPKKQKMNFKKKNLK